MNPWRRLGQIGDKHKRLQVNCIRDGANACQEQWLMDTLKRNQNTAWGRRYRFDQITTARDYQKRVPLQHYEELADAISAMAAGQRDVLFAGVPLMFERTSGSSGASKIIPYSAQSLADFQRALLPWLADVVHQYSITQGTAYWALSPVTRSQAFTEGGIPIGVSDAQYLGEDALVTFDELSAVPFRVAALDDVDEWKVATLYHLLRAGDLALVSVWSPTFLQLLLDGIIEHGSRLDTLLASGGPLAGEQVIPDETALSRLRDYVSQGKRGDCTVLWPGLKLVSCWGDASSEPYYRELAQQCPQAAFQRKGLLSTEGVVTVPGHSGEACLSLHSGFYEFLDDSGNALLAEGLRIGDSYRVLITTAGGLYRYFTGDEVICMERADGERGPALRFLGRSGVVSDLVGEKLTEVFVNQCLSSMEGFGVLVPAPRRKPQPAYLLLLGDDMATQSSDIASKIEGQLQENPQYSYARRIGQLGALEPRCLSEPLERYMAWSGHCDTRLGDIKLSSLRPEPGFASHMGVYA